MKTGDTVKDILSSSGKTYVIEDIGLDEEDIFNLGSISIKIEGMWTSSTFFRVIKTKKQTDFDLQLCDLIKETK